MGKIESSMTELGFLRSGYIAAQANNKAESSFYEHVTGCCCGQTHAMCRLGGQFCEKDDHKG